MRTAHLVYAVVNMTKRTLFPGLVLSLAAGLAAVPPVVLDASKLNHADVKEGVAVLEDGSNFLWAVDAEKRPTLFIDGNAVGPMKQARGKGPWIYTGNLQTGTTHSSYYLIAGTQLASLPVSPACGP